ncbi:MAG: hypothetical protein NTY38_16370, partial [Acidobacteria bacterium]|nr:hypothetical protein [Acidobacteriota bacterium]
FGATATTLFVLLAAWSLGRLAQVRFDKRDPGPGGGLVVLMLGFVLFVSALLFTAWFRIHYAGVYLAALAIPVLLTWRDNVQLVRRLRNAGSQLSTQETLALALLFYTLALHWLMALKPEISSDGLAMHLVLPAQVAFRHYWPFDFRLFVWALMPAGGDWAFTLAYLPGGEFAARLLNFSFLAATAAMIAAALSGRLSRTQALLVAALFASTPLIQMEAGNLMVEPCWAAILVAGVLALDQFDRGGELPWLMAAAVLAGFGLSIKFGSISFSLVLLVLALLRLGKSGLPNRKRWMAAAAGFFVLFGSWPYVNAWRLTGSPIFPFLNGVIQSPYFEPRTFVDARFRSPLSWRTLYDVTFHSHKFLEGQDGALGFQWLWLLPVLAVALAGARSKPGRTALLVAAIGWIATFSSQSYLRYIFPALPILALVMGLGWKRLGEIDPWLGRTVGALLLVVTALNVYFVSSSSWYHKNFLLNPFDPSERQAYLDEGAPARALVERINQGGEADPRVAFFEDNPIGELRGTPYTNTWHSNVFVWKMRKPTNPLEALDLYNRWGVTWFLAPKDPTRTFLIYASRFLETFTEQVAESGGMRLWRLRNEYRHVPRETAYRIYQQRLPAAGVGAYDDSSEQLAFSGPWIRDHQFSEALHGTVTYCATKTCTLEFRFTGRSLTWLHTGAPNRGRASVSIDGQEQVVDLYAPKVEWQRRISFAVPGGDHRVLVRTLEEKRPQATGSFVDLDGFEVK